MIRAVQVVRLLVKLVAGGWLFCLLAVVAWSMRKDTGQADVIVVLGAAQYAGRPSPVLRARLDHAITLWTDGRASHLMLTGGRHPGDEISEAAAGRRYALKRGVPDSVLLLEGEGRTTLESIRGAARILAAREHATAPGNTASPTRVLLVSDPFHMLRLDLLARLNGLHPIPSPTQSSPIAANRTLSMEYVLRESIAVPADLLLSAWLRVRPDDMSVAPDA